MAERARVTINHTVPGKVAYGATLGMFAALELILATARQRVPHEEGTLERSGATAVSRTTTGIKGSVSFDTPYAARQHEDLTAHHDQGRQAKYLESAFLDERQTAAKVIAQRIRNELT